jgi:hypothetical protein
MDRQVALLSSTRPDDAAEVFAAMHPIEPIELEPSTGLSPIADDRPRMDEPPPVRLVAVDDVRLPVLAKLVPLLTPFYAGLWQLLSEPGGLVFRAENFRLRFEPVRTPPPVERGSIRPQGIEVGSLIAAERKLVDAEIDYIRQRGLLPGQYSLLLQDPAGNWIELIDARPVG